MVSVRSDIWRRWVVACTAGELLGFGGIPVLGGAISLWLTEGLGAGERSLILYAVAVLGGLGEGTVLGWFQARILAEHLPEVTGHRWMRATALAAAFAWACGMLAPTADDLVGLSATARVAIWIPAGLLILFSIGTAQAWVLRGQVTRPGLWIAGNVLGWLAGLPWTFVLPALLPETAPLIVWIVTFCVAGVLMGATVGAVTGVFLLRLSPVAHRAGEGAA